MSLSLRHLLAIYVITIVSMVIVGFATAMAPRWALQGAFIFVMGFWVFPKVLIAVTEKLTADSK